MAHPQTQKRLNRDNNGIITTYGNKKPKSVEWENDIMATPTSKKNRIIISGTQSNLFIPILESNKAFNN